MVRMVPFEVSLSLEREGETPNNIIFCGVQGGVLSSVLSKILFFKFLIAEPADCHWGI